jgi:large subunit ribosomal protein L25
MELAVQARSITGKKLKELRKQGIVPAIIYGKHLANPIKISLNKNEFVKFYEKQGASTALTLKGDNIKELVLIQDIQLDPVQDYVLHIDFHAVKADEKVKSEVVIILEGTAPVEKLGEGKVQMVKDHIEVEAYPQDLPKEIIVDISILQTNQDSIQVKNLQVSDKVTVLDDPEETIVTVVELAQEEGEQTGEAGENQAAESDKTDDKAK